MTGLSAKMLSTRHGAALVIGVVSAPAAGWPPSVRTRPDQLQNKGRGRMMNRRWMLTIGLSIVMGVTAAGQLAWPADNARVRLRGTVESVAGDQLQLTLRNKKQANVTLPQDLRVTWLLTAPIDDIQPGSYVGTAATAQPDGTLKAMEVQVFP